MARNNAIKIDRQKETGIYNWVERQIVCQEIVWPEIIQ